jgi:hypothetical protein
MKFELQTLDEYSDEALLSELRRVADALDGQRLTIERFDSMARVHSTTVRHRFGSWPAALDRAEISETIAPRFKALSREKVVQVICDFAAENPGTAISKRVIAARLGVDAGSITRRCGEWKNLLAEGGFKPVPLARRYTDDECFENILTLWMHYGRQPHHAELKRPPSTVGPKAYDRFGGWRCALKAFVERANSDVPISEGISLEPPPPPRDVSARKRTPRDISWRLKYRVLLRDGNWCRLCGRHPPEVKIHIDHIMPWSAGGETVMENLRVLCEECNIGKGASTDECDGELFRRQRPGSALPAPATNR